jgi:hypothetical protein
MFGHDWEPAEGTVVDIRYDHQSQSDHGTSGEPHFLMDVYPASGEPFRTEVDELPLFLSFEPPNVGAKVKLECDLKRKKARFIRSDPAINKKTFEQRAATDYEAERQQGPAERPPAADLGRQLGAGDDPSEA